MAKDYLARIHPATAELICFFFPPFLATRICMKHSASQSKFKALTDQIRSDWHYDLIC